MEKIKLKEKLGFTLFSTSTNVVFNFHSVYYWTFLKQVLKVPVLWTTVIVVIGMIWDAINDPLIGFWSVNHKFKSGEKIRPLTKIFAIPWALTVLLSFVDFGLSESLTVIICIVIYLVFEAFYTFLCIPYNSMAALSTNNDADRRSINAYRNVGGLVGSVLGTVAVPLIVAGFGGLKSEIYTSEDTIAFLKTAALLSVVCIVGCLFHYFNSKERIHQKASNEEHISFLDTFKMLYSIKSWVYNMFFILCYGISIKLLLSEINDYASYVLVNSKATILISAFYVVAALITSILIGKFDNKYGHKKVMIFSGLIQVIGKLPFIFVPHSMIAIYINALSTGIGATAAFVMFNTNRNNVADIVEFKFGRRIDAMVSTCDNLVAKLGDAATVGIIGLVLHFTGFNAELGGTQSLATQNAICAFLGWAPAIVCLAMAYFATKTNVQEEYKLEQEKSKFN